VDFLSLTLLFFVSELILSISYMTHRILVLRSLAAVAYVGFIIASYLSGLMKSGMITTFCFASLNFVFNVVHIIRLIYLKLPQPVPKNVKAVYEGYFSSLTPREFITLLRFAEHHTLENEAIIQKGEYCSVSLVLWGKAYASVQEKIVGEILPGHFLGEISYLTGKPAIATVLAKEKVTVASWSKETIKALAKKHDELAAKFDQCLIKSLTDKLALSNENALHSVLYQLEEESS